MKKANVLSVLMMFGVLCGLIAAVPQSSAAQAQQQASPFKDRAEYDAYNAVEQAKDPAAQVEAAEKYLAAYPQSKVAERILTLKLQAYQQLNKVPELQETAEKLLEVNPKQVYALFLLSTLFPQTFNPQDPAADQKLSAAADRAKAGLEQTATLEKPANVPDADFKKQKDQLDAAFHQALGFASLQKKQYEPAQQELKKAIELNPTDAAGFYRLGIAYLTPEPRNYDQGIWALARAVSITGPTSLPGEMQTQVKDYLNKVYESQHGSKEGLDALLTQAATSPFPPPDFHIQTAEEMAPPEPEPTPTPEAKRELTVKPEELSSYDIIQKYLQAGGQKADDTWELLKGSQLTLPGKVVGATPAARPRTVQLAVAPELQNQDARFDVEVTLAAPSAKPIAKGETRTFEGTVDSYRAKPFLLKLVDAKEAR
ncbi:MAG: tetratricopeptide repeat protein [Acidobacteria bacterium]|nr:tetratricopeptide repeat protein [Acidobacteriota bacterium]